MRNRKLYKGSIRILLLSVVVIALCFGCQPDAGMDSDSSTIEDGQVVSFSSPDGVSLTIKLSEDGSLFICHIGKIDKDSDETDYRQLLKKYQSENAINLIGFYKEFTGNEVVPEDVAVMNDTIINLCSINEDSSEISERSTEDQLIEDQMTTINKSTTGDLKYSPMTKAEFAHDYGWYKYVYLQVTGSGSVEARSGWFTSIAYCYRGTLVHKVMYKTFGWRTGAYHTLQAGYLSSIFYSRIFSNQVKASVSSDTAGFHWAVEP